MPYKDREKRLKYLKEYYQRNKHKHNNYYKEYLEKNKEEIKLQRKKYREENKDLIKERKKQDWKKHKEKRLDTHKKWLSNNKEKHNEYMRKYCKDKRKKDKNYRISCLIRSRVWESFNDYTKKGKIHNCKKYNINIKKICDYLNKIYIEDYTIDHIIPLKLFNLENSEEVKIAFNPLNHQWLNKKENISKRDKLTKQGKELLKEIGIKYYNTILQRSRGMR